MEEFENFKIFESALLPFFQTVAPLASLDPPGGRVTKANPPGGRVTKPEDLRVRRYSSQLPPWDLKAGMKSQHSK